MLTKISIIIVHWNTPEQFQVQSSKFEVRKNIEVIVVDNSSDKKLEIRNKNLRLIQNKTNLGFAAACNQGAKIAKGEWLLFLNPDTHITSDEILKFIKNADERNFDAASPEQKGDSYYKPLPIWLSLAVEFSPLQRLIPLSLFKKRTLFGGCLLIKSAVLKKIGGWDDNFFLWFEDSDLTKRLYDNGYKVGWIPVQYSHEGGTSFKKLEEPYKKKMFFESMNLYSKKHFGTFGKLIVKVLTALNTR